MAMTPSQQRAIETDNPDVLVMAGAGSGKTFTVINRIARLVEKVGVPPRSILCLTFTRKAARELKTRLAQMIGPDKAKGIWAGTFHGISYRILSQWGEKIGYMTTDGEKITIVTPDESEKIMESIREEYGWKGSQKLIEEAKARLAHKGEFPDDPDLGRIIREYWSRLKECNAVDYDQLLLEVHRIFRECPDALTFYQNRFSHVFVDEYQDTDTIQYDLHEVLKPQFLFAVGDCRQAIYSWRGAEISIIQNFESAHPGAEIIDLLECFRCSRKIVEASNALIFKNAEGKKGLIPTIEGGEISVRRGGPQEAATYLSEELAFEDPGQIAVIGRTHKILQETADICRKKGLDVFKVGESSQSVQELPEWKSFLAVLRLVCNPADNIAFWSFGAEWLGLSADHRKQIKGLADSEGSFIMDAILTPKAGPDFARAKEQFLALRKIAADGVTSVWSFFINVLEYRPISASSFQTINQYLAQNGGDKLSPADFLEWVSTRDMHSELETGANKDHITLLTAHAAKGLEWETVILVGFNQGDFPSSRAIRERNLNEERRLAYVAFTRAKKRLVLFSDKDRSSFINEAGL